MYFRYEFWVTAHTTIGEGAPSQKATLSPTTRIPAKIASFDDSFVAVAKTDVQLPCIAVGNPSPQLHWKADGNPIPKNDKIRRKHLKLKFIYFEKATKFCESFTLLLTGTT